MWSWILNAGKWLFRDSPASVESRKDFRAINDAYEKFASDLRGELDQVRQESRECQEREAKLKRAFRKKIVKMRREFNVMRKADLERIKALETEVVRLQKQAEGL